MSGLNLKRETGKAGLFMLGFLAVLITVVPYFILGEDSVFTYEDQLDSEVIAYILQARHLFHGNDIAEFMDGVSKTALTAPAPLAILLFRSGHYCAALITMTFIGKLVAYAGMYLLLREIKVEKWIAVLTAVIYSCIPFLAVYGLSESGIPLLIWCALQLGKKKHLAVSYLYIVFFAASSSLVLVGFAVFAVGFFWCQSYIWHWQIDEWLFETGLNLEPSLNLHPFGATVMLLLTYCFENQRLLRELLGLSGTFISHRSAYTLKAGVFYETFLGDLLNGVQHAEGKHILLLACTAVVAVAGGVKLHALGDKKEQTELMGSVRPLLQVIYICFAFNLGFALVSTLWSSYIGIFFRYCISFLHSFQIDRFMWISPCLWYLAAACGLAIVYRLCRKRLRYIICLLPMLAAFAATAFWCLYSGEFRQNVQKLGNPDYEVLSYRDYYAIDVMEQAREFLDEYTGKDPDEYRVVSLGIDPAAALYHGFYCLDGYSNNYSLNYKMEFRQVIEPELERNEYLRKNFDEWGNRCYLFSSETPDNYTIEKHGFYFQDYRINTEALYEMGGRYLLSAALIQNAEAQGLTLLNEAPFETQDSYYCIYVYEVNVSTQDGMPSA